MMLLCDCFPLKEEIMLCMCTCESLYNHAINNAAWSATIWMIISEILVGCVAAWACMKEINGRRDNIIAYATLYNSKFNGNFILMDVVG